MHLQSTESTISSGDAIPYAVQNGTSGHGVSVSSGVITLPSGEWLISFTAELTSTTGFSADIYVNSSIDSTFPTVRALNSTGESNLDSTAIPLKSDGSTTVELRVNDDVTVSTNSDCLIYGYK